MLNNTPVYYIHFVLFLAQHCLWRLCPHKSTDPTCREGSKDRKKPRHFHLLFHPPWSEFPDDLWDRLLPYAEIALNIMHPWRPDPSLSVLHRLPYDFFTHPIHPPGQLCLAFSGLEHCDTWAPHGDCALPLAQPLATIAVNVSMSSPPGPGRSVPPALNGWTHHPHPRPPSSTPIS